MQFTIGGAFMINRTYAYARVSDKDQNEQRQINALIEAGVQQEFIMVDKQSGKDFDRPQYQFIKKLLRPGDLLVIKSIDRLGRNYKEILAEWQDITTNLKADIKVLDMPLLDTSQYKDLLGTFISDLILQVLAYVAQQERDYIKQRQREGIISAKEQKKHLGRPTIAMPENFEEIYRDWKIGELTAVRAMERLKVKKTTFYKMVKMFEKERKQLKIIK